ncbi:MAG: hypothetical protein GY850_40225 [bacterium]|nr:hypothetical protein [bacterium]
MNTKVELVSQQRNNVPNLPPARKIFERFPSLKEQELWGGKFWSDGKYIGTVGEATSEKTIRKYIKNQSPDKKKAESRMKQLKLFKFD